MYPALSTALVWKPYQGCHRSTLLSTQASRLTLAPSFSAVCPWTSRRGSGTLSFLVLGPSRFALGSEMYVWELWELEGGNSHLSSAPHIREVPLTSLTHFCLSRS